MKGRVVVKIQESDENYLETIHMLSKHKPYVRSIDIANELSFSKPSVSVAMKNLRENGYIHMDDQGHITLTQTGQDIADKMNQELGSNRVTLNLTDQYYNMKEVIEKDMTPVTIAKAVMEDLGITPIIEPIRGGTDGSKISFMGIPTPNIFAGGENMHGRFEYVSLQTMERAVDTIIGIVSYKD